MSTFVLIHGGWVGGWSWHKVVPLLEKQGHTAVAPDLPSHGRDRTPTATVSLQSYVDSVCKIVDAQAEPVVAVGHSMSGAVITQAAEYRPDKIRVLVYFSAFLPRNGESVFQIVQRDPQTLGPQHMIISEDHSWAMIKEELLKDMAFADCSDEDIALAKALLVPQPIAPLATPVTTTEANFGRVPRVYIEALQDRALFPSLQKEMYTALPCQKIISMHTSHFGIFSAPGEFARHLMSL